MVKRKHWINRIEMALQRRSIVWLAGVRRAGKTVLCQSLNNVEYFDCELPRVRQQMDAPQDFLDFHRGKRLIIDEIHRLMRPSELLKIAADYYPETKIVATGSSSLGASSKFADTLTGRKHDLWLTPMTMVDLDAFGNHDFDHRMLHGGLPPFFLSQTPQDADFQEWMDAYWAKDIQELFRLERKASFQKFVELILLHSGGIFEATSFATPCEVSRTTIANYLSTLVETYVAHVVKPYNTHRANEIVAAPKAYAFDTGFICAFNGWSTLRPENYGLLWEHLVLNELHSTCSRQSILYWRDKRGHEVDFVIASKQNRSAPTAIECKWSANGFQPRGMAAFRRIYPDGLNVVVSHDIDRPYQKTIKDMQVQFHSIQSLIEMLQPTSS